MLMPGPSRTDRLRPGPPWPARRRPGAAGPGSRTTRAPTRSGSRSREAEPPSPIWSPRRLGPQTGGPSMTMILGMPRRSTGAVYQKPDPLVSEAFSSSVSSVSRRVDLEHRHLSPSNRAGRMVLPVTQGWPLTDVGARHPVSVLPDSHLVERLDGIAREDAAGRRRSARCRMRESTCWWARPRGPSSSTGMPTARPGRCGGRSAAGGRSTTSSPTPTTGTMWAGGGNDWTGAGVWRSDRRRRAPGS